jgi:hypothetical protein
LCSIVLRRAFQSSCFDASRLLGCELASKHEDIRRIKRQWQEGRVSSGCCKRGEWTCLLLLACGAHIGIACRASSQRRRSTLARGQSESTSCSSFILPCSHDCARMRGVLADVARAGDGETAALRAVRQRRGSTRRQALIFGCKLNVSLSYKLIVLFNSFTLTLYV